MARRTVESRERWLVEHEALLAREKEQTRGATSCASAHGASVGAHRPGLHAADRGGPASLPQLFAGRSQLLLYHFMFWGRVEAGCPVNSSIADALDGLAPHLAARDVTLISSRERRSRSCWPFASGWAGISVGVDLRQRLRPRGSASRSTKEQIRDWLSSPELDRASRDARHTRRRRHRSGRLHDEGFGFTAMAVQDGAVHRPPRPPVGASSS